MRSFWIPVSLLCALFLAGCSGMPVGTNTQTVGSTPGAAITGVVHGGQSPIVGAHVYLYSVNTTGYAGPGIGDLSTNLAISELNSNVTSQTPAGGQDASGNWYATTDSNGDFTISGDYNCPAANPHMYLLAEGGSPGGQGSSNSAIVLAAGLGNCNDSGFSSLYVMVNEVSTVASAYAAAGFATDPTHVSSSSSSLAVKGVDNALASIVNLETLDTGVANTQPYGMNGTVPQAEINTLANILAACVNSTGPTSTPCTTLFNDAPNFSGTIPTETGTAILNIAHNPGANITGATGLFSLQTGNTVFQPDLPSAPNDFTIAISYTGGGLAGPYNVAVNAADDILVTNFGSNPGSVSAFNPL